MKSKKLLVLDLDHTLLDTDRFFHCDLPGALPQFRAKDVLWERNWERSYRSATEVGYTLDLHMREMAKLSLRRFPLHEIQMLLSEQFANLARYLFNDSLRFLEVAQERGWEIILMTAGNPAWQRYKATACQIAHLLSEIIYVPTKQRKALVLASSGRCLRREKIAVVENSGAELDAMTGIEGTERYFINRTPLQYMQPKDERERRRYLEAREVAERGSRYQHHACSVLPLHIL